MGQLALSGRHIYEVSFLWRFNCDLQQVFEHCSRLGLTVSDLIKKKNYFIMLPVLKYDIQLYACYVVVERLV